MIIENKFEEYVKTEALEKLNHLIYNIKLSFPELKDRLSEKELKIICDVFYDNFEKKYELNNYYKCLDNLISNSLYIAIDRNVRFDFKCIRHNKLFLLKYFSYIEILIIMNNIKKRINEEIECQIVKIKVR